MIEAAKALIRGKTVALVGNAVDILDHEDGAEIDSHDVVIRMNSGLPNPKHHKALGVRTSIQTLGKRRNFQDGLRAWLDYETPEMLWWMKSTRLGDKEYGRVMDTCEDLPVWRFPKEWQHEVEDVVPRPVSAGFAVCWALLTKGFRPSEFRTYGMSFFGAVGSSLSWWQMDKPSRYHNGKAELKGFLSLGFERNEEHWVWTG